MEILVKSDVKTPSIKYIVAKYMWKIAFCNEKLLQLLSFIDTLFLVYRYGGIKYSAQEMV